MSPELETLDQLQCSDLPVAVIRSLFLTDDAYLAASKAMLLNGEICLKLDGAIAPAHRWDALLGDLPGDAVLCITDKGLRRIR